MSKHSHKNKKISLETHFDALLVISLSYNYDANGSEAVEKIVTDGKDHKCSLYVPVCIVTAYQEQYKRWFIRTHLE